MTKIEEVWKDIPGYEGFYQVSNTGLVLSLSRYGCRNNRLLKLHDHPQGYLHVILCNQGLRRPLRVHQLVAMAFLGHTPNGYTKVINHKDFNRKNNHVDNLEVVTPRENCSLKHIPHSSKFTGVSWCSTKQKWVSRAMINRKRITIGYFRNEEKASQAYHDKLQDKTQ